VKPETLIVTSVLIILTMTLPRKWVLLPFVMAACIVPSNQRIIIANLDFTTLRFCVLFAMFRFCIRNEVRQIRWNAFDKLVLTWAVAGAIVYILQWKNMSAVIYKCGFLYDCLGLYWIFRNSIASWDDIHRVVKIFAIFAIISMVTIVYEKMTHQNLYYYLGRTSTVFHHGRFRCRGPFPHFIMMGLFWVSVIPIFVSYFAVRQSKLLYALASVSALVCVIISASSTPLMTLFAIAFFGALWKCRYYGKLISLGAAAMIFALHIVMKAPVWHLICRVNIYSGSTGYHRYVLFDRFINNIREWLLLGCRGVEHWGIWKGDITNQYVLEGVRGGALTLILFIVMVIQAVRIVGICSIVSRNRENRVLYWGICVSILGHCVSFFGVSYFGQIMMLLYITLAIVSFATNQLYSISIESSKVPVPNAI